MGKKNRKRIEKDKDKLIEKDRIEWKKKVGKEGKIIDRNVLIKFSQRCRDLTKFY